MAEQDIPAMDYAEHERTYHVFVEVSKVGVVHALQILVSILVLTSASTGLGMAVGVVLLVAAVIAAVAGMFARSGGWVAPLVILVLSLLQLVYIGA